MLLQVIVLPSLAPYRKFPVVNAWSPKIVFLTVHDDPDFARAALGTGALGYVLKPRLVSDLIVAINEALAGRTFVSPSDALGDLSQP